MRDHEGTTRAQTFTRLTVAAIISLSLSGSASAQIYDPVFKTVEMQATIAPLGEMVRGEFYGRTRLAAISRTEKAIYIFESDSLENLILTNVVTLPDSPVAISKAKEIVISNTGQKERDDQLVVLMKPHTAALITFGEDGLPEVSSKVSVDQYASAIRAADLETTGKLDIVTYGKFSLGIKIEKNLGNGRFREAQSSPSQLGNVPFSDIAFTDFNGDLVPDLAALDWVNRKLLIFYGRGDGTFAQPVTFPLKAEPSTLSVADLNGNGYPDIVVGYARLPQIDIFSGDGFGRFFLRQSIKTDAPVSKFAIADYTGDGTMDIAALSRPSDEIMLFAFDPLSKKFQYSGVIGIGRQYEDIVPFNFSNRIRADLVASSPSRKYLKIFKSTTVFPHRPEMQIPVCPNPEFVSVSGNDSSSFLVTGNGTGLVNLRFSRGIMLSHSRSSVDWHSEGSPEVVKVLSDIPPKLLMSYNNADMISMYQIGAAGASESAAMTAFLPFAVSGTVTGDSAALAAAYMIRPDSMVGISFFTSVKGKNEFLEHDFSVLDSLKYLTSQLVISPVLTFLRVWKPSKDSIELASTSLSASGSSYVRLPGSDAKLFDVEGESILALMGKDTLNLFSVQLGALSGLSLDSVCTMPLDSDYFRSVKVASLDSTYYLTYLNRTDRSVFLYSVDDQRLRFVKAWRVNDIPTDVSISPLMRKVYFLNSDEAYVSIHSY